MDLRVSQLQLRVHPPIKWGKLLITFVAIYIALTAALVVLP